MPAHAPQDFTRTTPLLVATPRPSSSLQRAQSACEYAVTSEQFSAALIRIRAERELERGMQAAMWSWYQGMAAQLQPGQLMPEAVAGPLRQLAAAAGVQVVWPPPAAATDGQAHTPAATQQADEQHGSDEGAPVLQGRPSVLQGAGQQAQHLPSVQQRPTVAGQKRKAAEVPAG